MQTVAGLAFGLMLVAALAAGTRLLLAAWRTRQDPELWIGIATLTTVVGGAIEAGSLRLADAGDVRRAFHLQVAARALYVVGASALYVGTIRIFQREESWAFALALVGSMLCAGIFGAFVAGGEHGRLAENGARLTVWVQASRIGPFLWGAIESFRYHRLMRRRMRLGLADPVIAHQFLLWGIASSSIVALLFVIGGSYAAYGGSPLDTTAGLVGVTLCGFAGGATIYTAFFPPVFYRRWVAAAVPA